MWTRFKPQQPQDPETDIFKSSVTFAQDEETGSPSDILSSITGDETEAESSILKSVEEGLDNDSTLNILPQVSDEDTDVFTEENTDQDEFSAEKSWTSHSLATRLARLSSAMHKARSSDSKTMSHRLSSSDGTLDTADSFVEHCNTLFRVRRRHSNHHSEQEPKNPGDMDAAKSTDAGSKQISRWRVFRRRSRDAQDSVWEFLESRQSGIQSYLKLRLLLGIVLLGVAALLFYAVGNPLLKTDGASISWLLIFIVRQLVVVSLTRITEHIVIGYLSLETRWTVRVLGTLGSLALVQSKGLPFRMVMWGAYSACLLGGSHQFSQHWLFYQDVVDMFNAENPSGEILSSSTYWKIIGISIGVGLLVSLKRLWWGLRVGRKTYEHFGDDVSSMIEKMILMSEVSMWSHALGEGSVSKSRKFHPVKIRAPLATSETIPGIFDPERKDPYTGQLNQSQKVRVLQILGDWEEPEVTKRKKEPTSVSAILEFRQALTYMETRYPFSRSFGLADRRENCVDSAQQLYSRLAETMPHGSLLSFEMVAQVAVKGDGSLDQAKVKSLIQMFRPDREGKMAMVEFVKSVDRVYREMKMLRASVVNASRMDNALEQIMNFLFYFVVFLIVVGLVGINPSAMLATVSALIVGFSFMIAEAASNFFAGMLFVLFRRPYDIGDRIASGSFDESADSECNTWFVQDADLYTTTARSASTNQVILLSNGTLASEPIINLNRSIKAIRHITVKFKHGVESANLQSFRRSLEAYVKARPREWLAMNGFRATKVDQDERSVEYVVVLQHREPYQNWGAILSSTADVESFCIELSDELGIKYSDE